MPPGSGDGGPTGRGAGASFGAVKRWRLAVALLPDAAVAAEVDVLRRAVGDVAIDRIPPHITLVPPVNVRGDDLAAALAAVRGAAGAAQPFELTLGPVASFEPVTPTIHLAVGGDVDALGALRAAVFRGPWHRAVGHPFVGHLTLLESAPLHRIRAAVLALGGYRSRLEVERVTVLAERRDADGRRLWRPVADVDLGGVRTIGRGGLPTELVAGTLVDPEVRATFPSVPDAVRGPVVAARRQGAVVGVAWRGGARSAEPEVADLLAGEVAWLTGGAGRG